ncbi:hypothetical protein C0993_008934 [Termitomyces sp. T159_Od127]|nr:hypothetical protein C0993_008934 [Termitomyces sp. T159_Od127]
MAGKSITKVQEAQRVLKGRSNPSTKSPPKAATTTTTSSKTFIAVTGMDEKMWYVDPSQLGQLPVPTKTATIVQIDVSTSESPLDHNMEYWEHVGFMAIDQNSAMVDWNTYAQHITENILAVDITPTNITGRLPIHSLHTTPFLIDSGAIVYISPCCKDFQTMP